jgi:hypothetical protein
MAKLQLLRKIRLGGNTGCEKSGLPRPDSQNPIRGPCQQEGIGHDRVLAMSDLLRHFLTALGVSESRSQPPIPQRGLIPPPIAQSNRGTTVFSGRVEDWFEYLTKPWEERHNGPIQMDIVIDGPARQIGFSARNEQSRAWAEALTESFATIPKALKGKEIPLRTFYEMVFDNPSNAVKGLTLGSCLKLPAAASREMLVDGDLVPNETRILVQDGLFTELAHLLSSKGNPVERLGRTWEVTRQVLLQLGHSSYPRDRFTERIRLTTNWALVNLHLLYDGRRDGRLEPGEAGKAFEELAAKREKIERHQLHIRDPFFRLLSELSFLLRERNIESLWETGAVIVRDYLDSRYLRLNIAGLMPERPPWLEAMPVEWRSTKRIRTRPPEVGRYGIIDDEDHAAWNKVRGPLESIGYIIIGQLGMGQFGRVYEAINVGNSSFPPRVAVKVDRIRKGHKKEAIEAADTIMAIAGGLAKSPHVIRIFDAGYLDKIRSNYHILQIVEGDTLDHLIGVVGLEHASILRPKSGRSSETETHSEFLKSLSGSAGEAWRRNRKSLPFVAAPGLGQIMDLLTSTVLWLEEVHHLGYAVNDLKNGNVMMSRRGQFKAIDLDSYSPVFSNLDKRPDFFFLAVSSLQLVTRGCAWESDATSTEIKSLLADADAVQNRLLQIWPYGDLEKQSDGRVSTAEVTGFFARFIDDSRSGRFSADPGLFSRAIDNLINLKRRLSTSEMILQ